jgi:GntR family transcriptional regulator
VSRTNFSAYMAIKTKLIETFRTESFENNKLPSEPTLAKRLGISLVTLREALLMLALEGYITKRHGSGNYVHPSTLNFENRSFYFYDIFKRQGAQPGLRVLSQEYRPAGEKVSNVLNCDADAQVLVSRVAYTADEKPSIITQMHMPANYLTRQDVENMSFVYIHELIWDFFSRQVAHALNEYKPVSASEEIASLMELEIGSPVIYSEQIFYDMHDIPLVYSFHYYDPQYYTIRTLQNWDLNTP